LVLLGVVFVLYLVFLVGGSYVETYRLNRIEMAYNQDPEGNYFDYEAELKILGMMRMATARFTESSSLWEKYLETDYKHFEYNKNQRQSFKSNMLILGDFYPYVFYVDDQKITDRIFLRGLSSLDELYTSYYLSNDLDSTERKLMACTYANYLPYAIQIKSTTDLASILTKIDQLYDVNKIDCMTVTSAEINDSKIIYQILIGNLAEAGRLYTLNYKQEVDEDFLTSFADDYVFSLLMSNKIKIGKTTPAMFAELERGINADPVKHLLFRYFYVPLGQWGYFLGGLK